MTNTNNRTKRDDGNSAVIETLAAAAQPVAAIQVLAESQVAAVSGGPETVIGSGTNPPH